jgi:effector-binding domain-containing protein
MNFFKGSLYFVSIILGAALLAALFAPAEKVVERHITIDANIDQVFPEIANFKKWPNWDPWYSKDTLQNRKYNGRFGDKTYGYTWRSDSKDVGAGEINVTAIEGKNRINFHLVFDDNGSKDEADGYFVLSEMNDQTRVSWSLVSKMSYPLKLFNYFIDGMLGPDFKQGLENLKHYVEQIEDTDTSIVSSSVQIISEFGVNYAAVKSENLKWSQMGEFFGDVYTQIYGYVQTNGLIPKGNTRTLYYTWDTVNMQTTLAAAVPISDLPKQDTIKVELDIGDGVLSNEWIQFLQVGDYSKSKQTHGSLGKWITQNNKEMVWPVIEEYIKGPQQTSDSSLYETRIIYHYK